ncbi:MAG: regulator of chromosome condensation [Labilithrix sp.]|nr:regulator of chromosome condensation [Labilithrix sp.]
MYCWGNNSTGELGDGSVTLRAEPVRVQGISDVLQVTVGDWGTLGGFSCALGRDHRVACWGQNNGGQLGDGTVSAFRATAAPVKGLADVVEIASATHHSCARLASGEVRCWGSGRDCGIGDGRSCEDAPVPVAAVGLEDATQLALSFTVSCALRRGGTVACWGSNAYGEAGNGTALATLVPTAVKGLTDVVRISAFSSAVCAQTRDGRVSCWGENVSGALGTGGPAKQSTTPVAVHGLGCDGVLMAGAPCVVTTDGTASCWAAPTGDGTELVHRDGAVPLATSDVLQVVGYRSLLAIRRDGRIAAWGWNDAGQLGGGSTGSQWRPVDVALPAL